MHAGAKYLNFIFIVHCAAMDNLCYYPYNLESVLMEKELVGREDYYEDGVYM
jgi:hypothetical protein